jgi:hypothetical protein
VKVRRKDSIHPVYDKTEARVGDVAALV